METKEDKSLKKKKAFKNLLVSVRNTNYISYKDLVMFFPGLVKPRELRHLPTMRGQCFSKASSSEQLALVCLPGREYANQPKRIKIGTINKDALHWSAT